MLWRAGCGPRAARSAVTSFQSLHCTLASSVRGPDLLPQLLDDGQQLCVFVLRHLAAGGALRAESGFYNIPKHTIPHFYQES